MRRAEVHHLAIDDVARHRDLGLVLRDHAQQSRRVADRRERVAQLVREHGEELVLAPVRVVQLAEDARGLRLELLLLRDVAHLDHRAERRIVAEHRACVGEHGEEPAVLADEPILVIAQLGPLRPGTVDRALLDRVVAAVGREWCTSSCMTRPRASASA